MLEIKMKRITCTQWIDTWPKCCKHHIVFNISTCSKFQNVSLAEDFSGDSACTCFGWVHTKTFVPESTDKDVAIICCHNKAVSINLDALIHKVRDLPLVHTGVIGCKETKENIYKFLTGSKKQCSQLICLMAGLWFTPLLLTP